jgi:hypothetical protein
VSLSRRWTVVAVALFVAASNLPAQIAWGPAIGLNLATLAGDDVTDAKMLLGFAAGVQLDKMTEGKPLFWRAGVHYSMQGSKTEDPGPPVSEGKFKLAYINVPLLAGWKFTPTKPNSPYLLIGPQLGLNVGCDIEAESGGSSATASCDDVGITTKGMDFGAVVGAGTSFAMGLSAVHVAVTYNLGLMTIDDGDPAADIKQRVLAFTFSYMMPSKRAANTGLRHFPK